MPENISWTLTVLVGSGLKTSVSQTITVGAYDVIDVSVVDGAADKVVEVQPGGAGQVQLLLITADEYGDNLSYKVNAPAGTSIRLDAPQVFAGDGAVGLLGAAPKTLLFSNTLGKAVSVSILVGRKATT